MTPLNILHWIRFIRLVYILWFKGKIMIIKNKLHISPIHFFISIKCLNTCYTVTSQKAPHSYDLHISEQSVTDFSDPVLRRES